MFSGLLDAAEAKESLTAGFGEGHAALDIFVDGEIDMGRELGVEVGVAMTAKEKGVEAAKGAQQAAHTGSSLFSWRRRDP